MANEKCEMIYGKSVLRSMSTNSELRGFSELFIRRPSGYLLFRNQPDAFCQTEELQGSNPIPVHVDFIPMKTVPCSTWMRVMVIVPAFAKSKQRHPPTIL